MKKIFTPFIIALLAFNFVCQYAKAIDFWDRTSEDPVAEIQLNTDYLLQNPRSGEFQYLAGTSTSSQAIGDAIYRFELAGEDEEGHPTYRLKQMSTGMYLQNPDLTNGEVSMVKSLAKAFVFTALPGVGFDAAVDENGDELQEWTDADVRTKYAKNGVEYQNIFVFCNKNYETSSYKWFEISTDPKGCSWNQKNNDNIWNLYPAQKMAGVDALYTALLYYLPQGIEGVFEAGDVPGKVKQSKIDHLADIYKKANDLVNQSGVDNETYFEMIDNLEKAYLDCKEGWNPVTPGFYVIDNNPAAGRATWANTPNACLTEKDGNLYWGGYTAPEKMTLEAAAFIWELEPAEDGGFYMRNCGTNRYAGAMPNTGRIVPTSAAPEQIYDMHRCYSEFFAIDQRGQNKNYPSLHADQVADMKMVVWEPNTPGSQWKFIPVDGSELKVFEDELQQKNLNEQAEKLIVKAKTLYQKGFVYSSKECTRDNVFLTGDGLITSGDQMISNAMESPDKEPGNCYANLVDGNFKTYFHTIWSDEAYGKDFHYLDIKLNEAVQTFNIKYAQRHNNSEGSPTRIHVYASNDTTGGQWTDQGYMTCDYRWDVELPKDDGTTEKRENFVGIASMQLDNNYEYLRFSVEETLGNRRSQTNLFWYWSELRLYPATYDASLSTIEAVPADVKKQFEDALEKAQQEIATGKITLATYEALEKAYSDFSAHFPDPAVLFKLLSEAEEQSDEVEEGTDWGFFAEGAVDEYKATLKNIRNNVKEVMTIEDIAQAKSQIEAASAAFASQLIVPDNNEFFYIQCASGQAAGKYLYAVNNDESPVRYATLDDRTNRLHFIWKSVKHADGSFSVMNCGTGTYLENPEKEDLNVRMSLEADHLNLSTGNQPGKFSFACGNNIYLGASSNRLYTYADSYSSFIFEPLTADDWDGSSVYFEFPESGIQIVSLPFDIKYADCTIYKVLGLKDGLLRLVEYGEEEGIPAGTPFFAVNESETNSTVFYTTDVPLSDMVYDTAGKLQNGLKATLKAEENVLGGGILFEGNIIEALEDDHVRANSGYFATTPSETTENGTLTMTFPGKIETGISEIVNAPAAKSGIYTISGVKVRNNGNLQNLPKGLYIVNGQKVLVK